MQIGIGSFEKKSLEFYTEVIKEELRRIIDIGELKTLASKEWYRIANRNTFPFYLGESVVFIDNLISFCFYFAFFSFCVY